MLVRAVRAGDCTPRGETQRDRQHNDSQLPHRGTPPRRALRLARHSHRRQLDVRLLMISEMDGGIAAVENGERADDGKGR